MRWRAVPGFEEYEVSSTGLVRHGAVMLKPWRSKNRYPAVTLTLGKKRYVHTLVLTAFRRGPKPGEEALHRDGSRDNNRLGNLRWGTVKQNSADRKKHGTHTCGQSHPTSKLTNAKVIRIRALCAEGQSHSKVAARFGVSRQQISAINARLWWRHI